MEVVHYYLSACISNDLLLLHTLVNLHYILEPFSHTFRSVQGFYVRNNLHCDKSRRGMKGGEKGG